jgi:ABC-type iron transport system FetAB ATPase subunit
MREILLHAQDLQFKHPFTCIIRGPTGSGKSSYCIRLLQHLDTLRTEPDFRGGIVWSYSEKTTVPMHEFANKIRYHKGVATEFGKAAAAYQV